MLTQIHLQTEADKIQALMEAGKLSEAEDACRVLNTQCPNHWGILRMMGVISRKNGKLQESRDLLLAACNLNPREPVLRYELGITQIELKDNEAGLDTFRALIDLDPTIQEAYVNVNALLEKLERYEEAVPFGEKALQMRPNCQISLYNMGNIWRALGDLPRAAEYYRKALAVRPDYKSALSNLSIVLLTDGQYAEGFDLYENRVQVKEVTLDNYTQPLWQGESLQGKTLLVHAEQGIGDEVMFANCYSDLIAQAKHCIFICEPRLEALFRRSFPAATVYGHMRRRDNAPYPVSEDVDFQIPAGSVPRFLRRSVDDFPRQDSYLLADRGQVNYWKAKFESLGPGYKVGISWRAGGKPSERRKRTTSLLDWHELLLAPGVQWVNLQYGDASQELRDVKETLGVTVHDFPEGDSLVDMDAFAAKMLGLDLVISCGNATVHLAGALGMPAFAMLPFMPAWRWLFRGESTPWYQSVKLFRQGKDESFEPTLRRLSVALRERFGITAPLLSAPKEHQSQAATQVDCLREVSEAALDAQLQVAQQSFNEGDRNTAEQICRRVLHHSPRHPTALHILAVIAVQTGRVELAVQSLRRAIAIDPFNSRHWLWLGESLLRSGEISEAKSSLVRSLELNPNSGRAHMALARVHLAAGDSTAAESVLQQLQNENLESADYLVAMGRFLQHTCRVDAAIDHFRRALALESDHLDALLELTAVLSEDGDFAAAEELCRRGIEKHPLAAELHYRLGHLLVLAGKLAEAIPALNKSLDLAPEDHQRLALLGETLLRTGQAAQAIASLRRAVELRPQDWKYHYALAQALMETGDWSGAEAELTLACGIAPREATIRHQRALVRLPQQNFAGGWDDYEFRFGSAHAAQQKRLCSAPIWQGESLVGKKILIVGEQGLGDEIMFATCLPEIIQQAATTVVLCDRRLASLFARSFPGATFVGIIRGREHLAALPKCFRPDVQSMLGSLPRFLRRSATDFPAPQKFLITDDAERDRWWQKLTELGPGLKVGVAFRGGTSALDRRTRWTELADWRPLLTLPGVQWINLQHDLTTEELAELHAQSPGFHHFRESTQADSLESLTALVSELDLVISVGNTNTHLAGGLGIPAWTLLLANSGWRWPREGDTGLWYPSVRLYRANGQEVWKDLFVRVREDLLKLAAMPGR